MMFKGGNKGAFSEFMRIKADWAIQIPSSIPIEKAGPLMCAGTTTYAPFKVFNVKPGQSVGVVGIGGLGHLSLQFARAWGCQVYAFSRGTSKETEAKHFGAHHFVNSEDPKELAKINGTLDFLMVTAGGPGIDFGALMQTLGPNGTMVIMGIIAPELKVSVMELIMNQKRVVGVAAGSTTTSKEMLKFAALHKIYPQTEEFSFDKINEAIDHTASGKARYRAVLIHK